MIYFTPLVDGSIIKELFSAYLKATKYKIPLKVNSVKLLWKYLLIKFTITFPKKNNNKKITYQVPTNRQLWCMMSPWVPLVPRTPAYRRKFQSCPRSPYPPCTDQSRQSWRSPQCPTTDCQASNLWKQKDT